MVEKEIILDTIKRMIEAGIDDNSIILTLKDVGINESQAISLLKDLRQGKQLKEKTVKESSLEEPLTGKEEMKLEEEISLPKLKSMHDFNSKTESLERAGTELSIAAEEHKNAVQDQKQLISSFASDFNELKNSVKEVNSKISSINQLFFDLDSRIQELNTNSVKMSANQLALKELLKRILETTRNILMNLEEKK